jgi:hypothetical protein
VVIVSSGPTSSTGRSCNVGCISSSVERSSDSLWPPTDTPASETLRSTSSPWVALSTIARTIRRTTTPTGSRAQSARLRRVRAVCTRRRRGRKRRGSTARDIWQPRRGGYRSPGWDPSRAAGGRAAFSCGQNRRSTGDSMPRSSS